MNVVQDLMSAGRPIDFHLSLVGRAQPEMKAFVAGRKITAGGGGESRLPVYPHARAKAIAVAARAAKSDRQPVQFAAAVEKNLSMSAECGDHNVLPAVVVEIAERGSARRGGDGTAGISALEAAIVIHRQQGRLEIVQGRVDMLDVVEDMTLGDEQIFPAVVVEILEANAPARTSAGKNSQTGFETAIAERTVAVIVLDAVDLTRQFGDDRVGPAVVVIVLKDHSHAGEPAPILRKSRAGFETDFGERAVTVIVK